MNVIETNCLSKVYGKNRGINNISLEVKKGEIFGFVGPNGAGKSTTIRTLLNFIFPTSGNGKILGMDIVKESKEIRKNIGYVPSEVRFYADMKVRELIKYASSFYNNIDNEYINNICILLEVDLEKKFNELSLGNKKKVAIVQAIVNKPKLLILDEPTNGLDPLIKKRLFKILEELRACGSTIFLSSHNLAEVEDLCDRVAVIKEGEIIDVINIKDERLINGYKIVVNGDELNESVIRNIGGEEVRIINDDISCIYLDDINKLIQQLSKYRLNKLLISEKTLEEKFMKYYE